MDLIPDDAGARCCPGDALCRLKHYEGAVIAYHNALAINGQDETAWRGLSNALRELGKRTAARSWYRLPLLSPSLTQFWLAVGHFCQDRQIFALAAACYRKAAALNPQDARMWLALGVVHRAVNNHKEAAVAYRNTLALNPRQASAWMQLGDALDNRKDRKSAVNAYRKALRLAVKWRERTATPLGDGLPCGGTAEVR
jgi:tetratricopeptide (TPR) repeat protein